MQRVSDALWLAHMTRSITYVGGMVLFWALLAGQHGEVDMCFHAFHWILRPVFAAAVGTLRARTRRGCNFFNCGPRMIGSRA